MVQETLNSKLQETTLNEYILDAIEIDVKNIGESILQDQFAGENIVSNKILMYSLNLNKIGLLNTKYGNLNDEKDLYLISTITNKVYYLKGVGDVYKYYTLTDKLKEQIKEINLQDEGLTASQNSQIIFEPSNRSYTNEPVTVKVKALNDCSISGITINDQGTYSVNVSEEYTEGDYTVLDINSNLEEINYTIEVSYTCDRK